MEQPHYEYETVYWGAPNDWTKHYVQTLQNEMGQAGWKLVAVSERHFFYRLKVTKNDHA